MIRSSFPIVSVSLALALFGACSSYPELKNDRGGLLGDGDGDRSMGGATDNIDIGDGDGDGDGDMSQGGSSNVVIPCAGVFCTEGQRCEDNECVNNTCDDLDCQSPEVCSRASGGGRICVDNSCNADVDCAEEEHCGGDGLCTADVCEQSTATCSGDDLLVCTNTGDEELTVACTSDAYFATTCDDSATPACTCEDDWDCPPFMECEVGVCTGTGQAPTCTLPAVPFTDTPPAVEIFWGGVSRDNDEAFDGTGVAAPWPVYSHVIGTPAVANLDDDNGDGLINELDFPEILFIGYEGHQASASGGTGDWKADGVVRAVHGGGPDKGRDFFARCGDSLWKEGDAAPSGCANGGSGANGDADALGGSTIAVADLDYDGVPEILYVREDDRLRILDNTGELILTTPNNTWSTNQDAETISVANLDYQGHAEIIVGRTVIMLEDDMDGDLMVSHILEGTETRGVNNFGPMSCVADVHPDAGQEIAAGAALYRLPDTLPSCMTPPCTGNLTLLWDADTVPENASKLPAEDEGYCAIANVWGADWNASPSPTNHPDDDGKPEVILIADGNLIILDAETGELIHQENLGGGETGGAPNVDDFDGDGFMEIASALQNFYIVVDLQDPTSNGDFSTLGACPDWPDMLTRAVGDNMDPTTYNPNLQSSGNTGDVAKPRTPGGSCTSDIDCADGATCGSQGSCVCLHNSWRRGSDDNSSRATSSSVFDFNGDGAAEVIYNDECEMRVYDGANGEVYYNELSRSRTAIENPLVADVDNDGNAEIVTVLNTEANNRCNDDSGDTAGPNGIRVWGDPTDTWVSARRIWNQQSYHVTNVTEAGGIPLHPPESWGSFGGRVYNTYRSQPRNFGVAPDLTVAGVSVSSPDAQCGTLSELLDIGFQLENIGDLRVGPGVEVSFFGTWDGSEEALVDGAGDPIVYVIEQSLEPGAALIDSVSFDSNDQSGQSGLPDSVRVEVDTGGDAMSSVGAERECVEDNNDASAAVDAGVARADLTIGAGAADLSCGSGNVTLDITVQNDGSSGASGVVVAVFAGDPAQGGQLVHTETLSGNITAGGSRNETISFSGGQSLQGATLVAIVDPDNMEDECNEANNADAADNALRRCEIIVN